MDPSDSLILTPYLLRQLVMCERRVWLDQHGDPALRDDVPTPVEALFASGIQHERTVHAATAGLLEDVPVASWEEGVAVTRDLMHQGSALILGAYLEAAAEVELDAPPVILRGKVDRLVRLDRGRYAPVEIKQRAYPVEADWLQLDFYVWLLSLLQGSPPPAELWLGRDRYGQPARRLEHAYDEDRLLDALARACAVLRAPAEPPIRLEPHCKSCGWYSSCAGAARRAGDIDLLYKVSRQTRANLRRAGIVSLAQLAALTAEELQQVKGIGERTAPAVRANAQAWLEQRPVWYRPLPEVCLGAGWMFDLETLDDGRPWSLGWCDPQGNTHIALLAPVDAPRTFALADGQAVTLAPDTDHLWDVFAAAVGQRDGPIYHWTGYDAGVLRATAPAEITAGVGPRFHDLHGTFTRCVSLPLGSTSIKIVSAYLGFPWIGGKDWFAAYLDYRRWLENDDEAALLRACTYQRADVQSLAWVWRWLIAHHDPPG